MLEIIAILTIGLLTRISIAHGKKTSFDTYGHLYFAKEVNDQRVGPFGKIQTKVASSKGFKYPFLWHWILGFLPLKLVIRHHKWINPIADVLFSIALYLISVYSGLEQRTSLLLSVIYLLTPMWFSKMSMGPRIESLTPRLSSEIATNLFFIVTVLPLDIPFAMKLTLGTLLSAYVIMSFKFGLQAILFMTPFVSLFVFNSIPLISAIIAIIFSIVISKGDFLETIKRQITHFTWYFRKNLKEETTLSNRNSWKKLFICSGKSVMKLMASNWLFANSFTSVILKMPIYVINHISEIVKRTDVSEVGIGSMVVYQKRNGCVGKLPRYIHPLASHKH